MTPLKIAIVGAGIGAKHYEALAALRERFEVTAICDLDTARAQALVDKIAGPAVIGSMPELLDDPSIDLIDICLPPHLHFDACRQVLEAGKHVVCEKPLVTSLAEADQLHDIAKAVGRQVYPVFQYRFGPGIAQLQALIESGVAGKPLVASLETHWNRGAEYYAVPWRGTWAGEQGGAVLGHAIHAHDLLSLILGPAAAVSAALTTRANDIEVEDCGALWVRMASGAVATSSITLGAAIDTSRLRFCFSGVTAESGTNPYAPAEDSWTFTARGPVLQADVDRIVADAGDAPAGYAGFFTEIAKAISGEGGRPVTMDDARRSLEFVTAVYHSARTGEQVTLPLQARHPLYRSWLPE